jgi:hypothetical protein
MPGPLFTLRQVARARRRLLSARAITGLFACLVINAAPAPSAAQAPGPPTFYDLDDDPDALMLFGLDSIDGRGAVRTFIIANVFRGESKFGNMFTWQINCPQKTMHIIKGIQFDDKHGGEPRTLKGANIRIKPNGYTHQAYTLACGGAANLRRDKAYFGELNSIISEFWR